MLDSSVTVSMSKAIPAAAPTDWKIFAVLVLMAILALGPKALDSWASFRKKGSEDPSCPSAGAGGCIVYERRIKALEDKADTFGNSLGSLTNQVTQQLGHHRVEMRDLLSEELSKMRNEQREERKELLNHITDLIRKGVNS